jgi:hypothetical protein
MRSEQEIRERVKYLDNLIQKCYAEAATRAVFNDRRGLLVARGAEAEAKREVLHWVLGQE